LCYNEDDGEMTLINGFAEKAYNTLDIPLVIEVPGIFTLRSVRPTSTFVFVTFDANGYAIDTHSTFVLAPLVNAKVMQELSVI
jgi:hypothetical protein